MPKPAFNTIENAPQNSNNPKTTKEDAPKPKCLQFGDALAEGLPKTWSILPPNGGIIPKPRS